MEYFDLLAKQISRCHCHARALEGGRAVDSREDSGRTDGCRSYILGRTQPQAHHVTRNFTSFAQEGTRGSQGPQTLQSPGPSDLPRGLQPHQPKFRDSRFFEPPLNIVARTPRGSSFHRPSLVSCQVCPSRSFNNSGGPLPRIVDTPGWGLHFQACSDAWRPKEE